MSATRIPTRAEALKLLGLEHPLDYEAKVLASILDGDPPTRTGWTTRLCLEAAVDVLNTRIVMMVAYDNAVLEAMMQVVRQYVTRMNGLHAGYILGALGPAFHAKHGQDEVVHDDGGNPVVVYQDHWIRLKNIGSSEDHRLLGPFGEIREVRRNHGGRLTAHDYDGNYLMDLTEDGLQELLEDHRWRIRVIGPEAAKTRPGASAFGPSSSTIRGVRVRADGPISTRNLMAPRVVDGGRLSAGDHVLVVGQRDPKDDGIYVVGNPGGDGRTVGGTWSRVKGPPSGTPVMVHEGDTYTGTTMVRTSGPAWSGASSSKEEDDIDELIAQINDVPDKKGKTLLEVFAEEDAKQRDGVASQDEIEDILTLVFGKD